MTTFETIQKPVLSPPGWLFPIVWTVLYILMGIASYLVLTTESSQHVTLFIYKIQLFFNFIWPIIFFNLRLYLLAFIWLIILWLLILITAILFYKTNAPISYLGNFCWLFKSFDLSFKLSSTIKKPFTICKRLFAIYKNCRISITNFSSRLINLFVISFVFSSAASY